MKSNPLVSFGLLLLLGSTLLINVFGQSRPKANTLKLALKTVADDQEVPKTLFTTDEVVQVRVTAHNRGVEQINVFLERPRTPFVVSLVKNGKLVEYSSAAKKQIEALREIGFGKGIIVTVPPGQLKDLTTLSLDTWYKKLAPGDYELSVSLKLGTEGETKPEKVRFTVTSK